ncbi:MAG: thiol-disulfide isomerase or thioredoxin [Chitinophagaceae bacterium]|nr:thiol-disulfide isomerase or thioredoxin [Chitinophagaceae bacterium]
MVLKKTIALLLLTFLVVSAVWLSSVYKVGDTITDFKLKNIDNKEVSLSDYKEAKGYIIVFTCNHCPYAKAYEDRIIDLQKKYGKTYPVIAINPNDAVKYPDDSFENMRKRASDKKYPFVYLHDDTQSVAHLFGATKTPHVYLVQKEGVKNVIKYIGAIDNNYQDSKAATEFYVASAIAELEAGKDVSIKETKAIGCGIKWKE